MRVDEASLTGESVPVDKRTEATAPDAALADRTSMLHAGTGVVAGNGRAVVTATGRDTQLGDLGQLVAEAREPDTPLQQAMRQLARVILVAAVGASVLVPAVLSSAVRLVFLVIGAGDTVLRVDGCRRRRKWRHSSGVKMP